LDFSALFPPEAFSMNKYMIPILVLVILLGGCIGETEEEVKTTTISTTVMETSTTIQETTTSTTIWEIATSTIEKEKVETSECDEIQNQYRKDYCYVEIAFTREDPSLCDWIQNQHIKDYCYVGVAFASDDLSICERIQNQDTKKSCYNQEGTVRLVQSGTL